MIVSRATLPMMSIMGINHKMTHNYNNHSHDWSLIPSLIFVRQLTCEHKDSPYCMEYPTSHSAIIPNLVLMRLENNTFMNCLLLMTGGVKDLQIKLFYQNKPLV